VKKILGLLESMAKDKPEDYKQFWQNFGVVLKEGPAEDFGNKEQIAKLFLFHSTYDEGSEPAVKLDDYISRMKDGQDKIYYITADSLAAAKNSPHLEAFKKRGIEVLLMSDRIDEWMMQYLTEYDEKKFASISKGDLDLGELDSEEEKTQAKEVKEAAKDTVERIKKALGEKVQDVRATTRLTDSPACVVLSEHDMALHMQRLMKQAGHAVPESKPILEINPTHALIKRIEEEKDDTVFNQWADLLLDQAIIAEGGQLENPAEFVKQVNKLLLS
jgi:molecular chaperone HtpG